MITSIRYFCPVPDCIARCAASAPQFSVSLGLTNETTGSLNRSTSFDVVLVRRTQPFVTATICTQPMWGYPRMKKMYPAILDEWLAYHYSKGFRRAVLYEQLDADFEEDLAPWKAQGFVDYHSRWSSGLWATDAEKTQYCTQCVAHDHCVFVNRLRSRWVSLVHGLDLYYCSNCVDVASAFQPYANARNSELRVGRKDCGGARVSGTRSLQLSFNLCDAPNPSHVHPTFDPMQSMATFVHQNLVTFPLFSLFLSPSLLY